VEATDMAGNHIMHSRMVELDDVPPVLAVQSPIDGSHQNDMTIHVVGTTDPDSTVLVNGELVDLDRVLFSYSFVGVIGENAVIISASDRAGNVVSTELTVFIDNEPPEVDITSPSIEGSLVTDPDYIITGETEGAAWVWVNGEQHPVMEDGTFTVNVTLLEGTNRFIITVEDLAGNYVTENRFVTLDTIAPVLVIRIPNLVEKDGTNVFKTEKGEPSVMVITGFTDKGVQVRVDGTLVPISTDGYFVIEHLLNVNRENIITITATDAAGNVATYDITVTHKHFSGAAESTFDWGLLILVVGIILLVIAIFLGWRRLSEVEEAQEIEVEEEEVLAPAAMPELDEEEVEEEDEEEDEEIVVDEEEDEELVHELTPPGERPKTETSRPAYESSDEEVTIEVEEKDLDEKDADADVEADELDQEEGI
jgi:hypothetical protein